MSVCAFNSLPNKEYSNLLIEAAISNSYFSGKNSPVKISYLPTFAYDKAIILAVCLSHIEFVLLILLSIV